MAAVGLIFWCNGMFGTSTGGDDADLIGLISSFLGPSSGSDATKPKPKPKSSVSSAASNDVATSSNNISSTITEANAYTETARVIIFSKDRPWQLQQLFKSMKLRKDNDDALCNTEIFVIVRSSTPAFAGGYETVMQDYDHGVQFLIEDDQVKEKSFSSLLHQALSLSDGVDDDDGIVMFLTDDCLLLEPLETTIALSLGALQSPSLNSGVFNFLSRLHPGISWCQTRGIASPPPRDAMKYHPLAGYLSKFYKRDHNSQHDGIYLYNRTRCIGEWAYHFDFSGGVYHHNDVLTLFSHMKEEDKCHPNTLEMRANQLLNREKDDSMFHEHLNDSKKPLAAIPTRPLMVILAVNRVQDVYQAPLAAPSVVSFGSDEKLSVDPSDAMSLLGLLGKGCNLDVERYKSTIFNTSHIGDFFMKNPENDHFKGAHFLESTPSRPKVSVLIPIHRGPPEAASHAIRSIIMQAIDELHLCNEDELCSVEAAHNKSLLLPMQIVLVDDRCNDGSIGVMIRSCEELVKSHHDIMSYTLHDHRNESSVQEEDTGRLQTLSLDIVQSPRAGVACALNHGLRYCRANLIARMDADDISTPGRLLSQISFMHANPSITVVGTSTVLFSETETSNEDQDSYSSDMVLPYSELTRKSSCSVLRPSLSISDSGFMAWAMLFTCSVSHPSVVFRKNVVQELGGYDESISRCEDYDLWLRLLNQHSKSIVCLPFHGLWHRKHNQSSSSVGLKTQKEEADKARYKGLAHLLHSTNNDADLLEFEHVSTLRNPSSAQTSTSLDHAAKLLVRLESSFLQKNSEHLTQQEIALIYLDCSARIGEIATVLVTKFGSNGNHDNDGITSFAWKLWCERCPDKQLERLALLCHTKVVESSEEIL